MEKNKQSKIERELKQEIAECIREAEDGFAYFSETQQTNGNVMEYTLRRTQHMQNKAIIAQNELIINYLENLKGGQK
jgi:uncharacterized protein YdhG (YjbR/CyaY superfamily)